MKVQIAMPPSREGNANDWRSECLTLNFSEKYSIILATERCQQVSAAPHTPSKFELPISERHENR